MSKDYYKILGVARNATKDEIKKRYRELAHKHHPDKGGDEQRFKEISEAYQILADDKKRSQYDQFGQVFEGGRQAGGFGFEWPGGFRFDFGGTDGRFADFDFSDVFEDFWGGFGSARRAKNRERKGADVKLDLAITLEEAVLGGKREIEFARIARCGRCGGLGGEQGAKLKTCDACGGNGNTQKTKQTIFGSFTQVASCQECGGSGKKPEILCRSCGGRGAERVLEKTEVFIPRGCRDGETLKITGRGDVSSHGGQPGDLYLEVRLLPHRVFRRQGDDLTTVLPVKFSQAVLGGVLEIKSIEGTVLRVKIPEGTQSGDILKIRGKGSYFSSGYGRGDLLMEIKVEVPKHPNKKIREIMEKLKEEGY